MVWPEKSTKRQRIASKALMLLAALPSNEMDDQPAFISRFSAFPLHAFGYSFTLKPNLQQCMSISYATVVVVLLLYYYCTTYTSL